MSRRVTTIEAEEAIASSLILQTFFFVIVFYKCLCKYNAMDNTI